MNNRYEVRYELPFGHEVLGAFPYWKEAAGFMLFDCVQYPADDLVIVDTQEERHASHS